MADGKGRQARRRQGHLYWIRDEQTIYLLTMYLKTRQDDLTTRQIATLSRLDQEELD